MKNLKPLSNSERQADHRARLALKNGKRLSISVSPEAVDAIQVAQKFLKKKKLPATKKAAIEAHTEATKRIFPVRGGSEDQKNVRLGRYSTSTAKIRRKKGLRTGAIVLQFSGQLEKSWNVIEQGGMWISAFLISGRTSALPTKRKSKNKSRKIPSNDDY